MVVLFIYLFIDSRYMKVSRRQRKNNREKKKKDRECVYDVLFIRNQQYYVSLCVREQLKTF